LTVYNGYIIQHLKYSAQNSSSQLTKDTDLLEKYSKMQQNWRLEHADSTNKKDCRTGTCNSGMERIRGSVMKAFKILKVKEKSRDQELPSDIGRGKPF
jgi:hypothetical protein